MKNHTIRFIEEKDLDELMILCKEHAEYEKSEFRHEKKKESLSKHLFNKNKTLYCIIVEIDNKVVGYATYMKQFSTWDASFYLYMDCLFLKNSCRNKGIGKELISQIKENAIKLECNEIQWQTPIFNTKAIEFYKSIGAFCKNKERFFLKSI